MREFFNKFLLFSLIISCSTIHEAKSTKETVNLQNTILKNQYLLPSGHEIKSKITAFRKILASKRHLSKSDWQLHDELLDHYIQLKRLRKGQITVPARGSTKLRVKSFCLNASKAAPSSNEVFEWRQGLPNIPYLRELLEKAKTLNQQDIQAIIWNLNSETKWEDYPTKYKDILLSIDPNAPYKLPSQMKSSLTNHVADFIKENIPYSEKAIETSNKIQSTFKSYENLQREILSRVSTLPMPENMDSKIPDTNIISRTKSHGFSEQEIELVNLTDEDKEIDLSNYYLNPKRNDVQRIALIPKTDSDNLFGELEKLLFGETLRLGIGLTPGVNDIADIYEFLTGRHFTTGEKLDLSGRLLSGLGVIAGNGESFRWIKRYLSAPVEESANFERAFARISEKSLSRAAIEEKEVASAFREAESMMENGGRVKKFGPLKTGPLEPEVAKTFRSSTYFEITTNEEIKLYRTYSRDEAKFGEYWTREKPRGPVEVSIDKAIHPDFQNKATQIVELIVPKNTVIYEGFAGPYKQMQGGGTQVFVNRETLTEVLKKL